MEGKEPKAFIVGMSRAGTTWFVSQFNRHPECAAFGETAFFGKHFLGANGEVYPAERIDRALKAMPGVRGVSLEPRTGEVVERVLSGDGLRKLFDPLRKRLVEDGGDLNAPDLFNQVIAHVAEYTGKEHVIEKTPHHILYTDRIIQFYPETKFLVCFRAPEGFIRSWKHQGDRKDAAAKKAFQRMYHPAIAPLSGEILGRHTAIERDLGA